MARRPSVATILSEEQRDRAHVIGAGIYLKSRRYRLLREDHVFRALDGAVVSMESLKFANPYDGKVIGGLATVLLRSDPKAIGYLRQRNVAALDDNSERDELFMLAGLLVAEDYLRSRKDHIPHTPRLADPSVLIGHLDDLFEQMSQAGSAMSLEVVRTSEMAVSIDGLTDPTEIARNLIGGAIESYESLVPETDTDSEVPEAVQRRSISKAAFLRLAVDDLAEVAAADGILGLPNKEALATALADRYGEDLNAVARLVVRRTEGDPTMDWLRASCHS